MEDQNETRISLKLLVDSKTKKVLFAEAGKAFVDFILHILSLPLGTIVKLLSQMNLVGCLGDLFKSIEDLKTQYFESCVNKDSVLNPKPPVNVPLLSLNVAPTADTNTFYQCISKCGYVTNFLGRKCPDCRQGMTLEMEYAGPQGPVNTTSSTSGSEGYVKGVVTYMVMDNLEVKPMSTISGITLINRLDVSSLEEKEVQVGLKEGLAILKASMETKAVLTHVFLGNKI